MKIETKFDLYQEVFTLFDNRVQTGEIQSIAVYPNSKKYCAPGGATIFFRVKFDGVDFEHLFKETEIFISKEELLKSL
jgi:hypothetical protein